MAMEWRFNKINIDNCGKVHIRFNGIICGYHMICGYNLWYDAISSLQSK